jgi:hypothetical protein
VFYPSYIVHWLSALRLPSQYKDVKVMIFFGRFLDGNILKLKYCDSASKWVGKFTDLLMNTF